MSLYNMVFGKNYMSPVLLAILGIDQEDGKWPSGRFRDIYVKKTEKGEYRIVLYTRNGGGNRGCWHAEDPVWGSVECKHHVIERIEDEWIEVPESEAEKYKVHGVRTWRRGVAMVEVQTGKRIKVNRYVCENPKSADCACPGCVIQYRMKKHPNYITGYDEDLDCTYASIEFCIPEAYKKSIGEFYDENGVEPAEKFRALFKAMEETPDSPEIKRISESMKPIMDAITKAVKGEG